MKNPPAVRYWNFLIKAIYDYVSRMDEITIKINPETKFQDIVYATYSTQEKLKRIDLINIEDWFFRSIVSILNWNMHKGYVINEKMSLKSYLEQVCEKYKAIIR
jgi:hypothetical protein